jgi:hypothetical protein
MTTRARGVDRPRLSREQREAILDHVFQRLLISPSDDDRDDDRDDERRGQREPARPPSNRGVTHEVNRSSD